MDQKKVKTRIIESMSIKRFMKNVKGSLFWKRVTAGLLVILMIGTLILPERFTLRTRADDQLSDIELSTVENTEDVYTEPVEHAEKGTAFRKSQTVDGITVSVSADEGVFPEGAALRVEKVSDALGQQIDQAVGTVRDDNAMVAQAYTFDIKVLDENGNEIQPADGQTVNVSFAMDEVSNQNLTADVYHIPEEDGSFVAEELNATESGDTVTAVADGFSYYTVEFTYDEKQYVMQGDSSVALVDILSFVGITKADGSAATDSDITAVSVSNESLFSASNESGEWMVTAHQAFSTDEWLKVTVDGVEYEIVVTDDAGAGVYKITITSAHAEWNFMGSWSSQTVEGVYVELLDSQGTSVTNGTINGSSGTITLTSDVEIHTYRFQILSNLAGNPTFLTANLDEGRLEQNDGHNYITFTATHPAAHSHSWTYSANGNKITAHCNGSGTCSVGDQTLTLGTVSGKTYNETAQTTPSYTTTDGWTTANGLAEPGTVTVSPANSANAGTYTASVSAGGATAKSSWTISKATNPLTYTSTQSVTKTFSTSSQTAALAAATKGQGTVSYVINSQKNSSNATVSYFSISGTTLTVAANTPAGTYTVVVRATAAGNGNYSEGTKDSTVTVTIGNATMTGVSANGYTGTYDASAHSITVNKPSGATVKYRTASSGDYNLTTNPTFTDAGTHTVYYQVTKPNYTAVTGSATVQINPKGLTLNWSTNNTFTYNGSSQEPTATISGVINGDDCTVSVSGAQTNYSATAYTATAVLNGTKKDNYALPTDKTTTFTIGKKAATITANNRTVTYGTPIASDVAGVTTAGLVDGDILTAITLTPSTSDVTTSGTIRPSGATIKKGAADVTSNYNITYTDGALTINKKTITISGITAEDKTYDGTKAVTLNYNGINWTDCGRVGTDDLSVTATGTFSDANVGTGKTVTITGLTLGGAKAGNYELASSGQQTSTTADIREKAITITADSDSKVYDGTAHTKNSYRITSGGLATGDSIESVTVTGSQTFVGSSDNVPGAAVINNSSHVDVTANYDITYSNGILTVTKKPLTITADSDTKVYDSIPLTKNSYTHTELASGDNITSVTITGSQTSVGESANEPSAAVIKKGDEDVTTNYDITYANGTLKVTKKVVAITANSDTKIYDGTALTNDGYTVSGLEAGDRVDSVTITGSQIIVGESANVPSAAVIKNSANEEVNNNYTISYVNGTLEVTKKAITITADSDTKVYDGTALTKDGYRITDGELASGDSIVSVTVTGAQTIAGESANVPSAAVIKNANGDGVTASYDITYVNGTLEVTPKAVTITADDATKVYDGTALTINSYTNSDLAAGDVIENVNVTGSQTNASQSANVPGEAVIKNAADEDVTASYDITYVDGTLEVTKKSITVDGITAKDKIYDGTTEAELDYSDIDWSAYGMVDGDKLSVTATGTFENADAGTDKEVAITDIILDGESIDNYVLADAGQQSAATATINKKSATVTALKQTVAVNGEIENSVEFAIISGVLEGHTLAEITLTSGSTAQTTTEGVITPSAAIIVNGDTDVTDNYDISYIDGIMTVTKAEAEVVLDNGDDGTPASVTEVEVPNLLELADEEAEEGKLVKVELSVKPVSESKVSTETVSDVKKAVESLFAFVDMESVKVEYLEIDLTKYVDNVKEGVISNTGRPLEIILTYDTSKAGNPVIIRNHEGTVNVFTQLSARPSDNFTDASYYVEDNKIYMYSQYFSDFAIAYSVEKTYNVSLDDGSGNIIRQIVSAGAKFIPPSDLTKDGYDFDGWYKDETFTEKWNPDTDTVTSDIKLFAKWTKTEVTTTSTTETTTTEATTASTTATTTAAASTSDATTTASAKAAAEDKTAPKTGDAAPIAVLVVLMFAAAGMLVFVDLKKKKN
ncbi:MAG: InlB B-repeat-containing protein [Lachnospiraceae bacterium]|nr:InlB B-repeat-containing protein [Lachnospiraceae bacterium]